MIAMNSNHNLSRDDLRIYFNKENDKFYPIYYDGSVHLGDQNLFLLEDCISKYKKMNCNYTPSAVEGSKDAIKLLDGINIKKFKKNLLINNLDQNELNLIQKKILISNYRKINYQIPEKSNYVARKKLIDNERLVKIELQMIPFQITIKEKNLKF